MAHDPGRLLVRSKACPRENTHHRRLPLKTLCRRQRRTRQRRRYNDSPGTLYPQSHHHVHTQLQDPLGPTTTPLTNERMGRCIQTDEIRIYAQRTMGQRFMTSRTPRPTPKKTNHGRISQCSYSRTPWQRRNHTTSHATVLVAFNENLASGLCLRLRNLPTKQDPHTPAKNPHLPNPDNRECPSFPTCLP